MIAPALPSIESFGGFGLLILISAVFFGLFAAIALTEKDHWKLKDGEERSQRIRDLNCVITTPRLSPQRTVRFASDE